MGERAGEGQAFWRKSPRNVPFRLFRKAVFTSFVDPLEKVYGHNAGIGQKETGMRLGAEAATWHYLVAAFGFVLVGVFAHICRAVFNVYPDRLSDRPMMDLVISDGYDWSDRIFGTEYDDAGYYRLDSLKNLRLSCVFSLIGGMAVMLLAPGASIAIAAAIDWSVLALWNLFLERLANVKLV